MKYIIQDTTLQDIGDAIRAHTGKSEQLSPMQMAEEITGTLGNIAGLIDRTTTDIYHSGVTEVAPFAFYSYTGLQTVEFPNCASVGNSAFVSCTGLTSISLPNCTSASTSAFTGCKNIQNATLGFSSTMTSTIFPFKAASASLATMNLPNCTSIANGVFKGYTKLADINAPVCTALASQAFSGCTSLDTVYLPQCTTASTTAFTGCKNITNVTIGLDNITSTNFPFKPASSTITELHFSNCSVIGQSIFMGNIVSTIINYPNLTVADFPACTSVGSCAFSMCTALQSVSFPSCTNIEDAGFYNCHILNPNFPVCTTVGEYAFGANPFTSVNFPLCETIGSYAFAMCRQLTEATFPKCSIIYPRAFNWCQKLTSLTLPGSYVVSLKASAANIFSSAAFMDSGLVYVPSSLVSTYQSATYWSEIAHKIRAIV